MELLFIDPNSQTNADQIEGSLKTYEYSTVKTIRDNAQNLLAPPSISSIGQDRDNDGQYEQWNITLKIKKPEPQLKLLKADFITAFDYRTN